MRGRSIPLTPARRAVADLMKLTIGIPLASVVRRMNVARVIAARRGAATSIPWTALFMKAYALVAAEFPELRRAFLKFPRPHLYEYPASVAALTVEREFRGEMRVFALIVKDPAALTLGEIARMIDDVQNSPIESIKPFYRLERIINYPRFLQRIIWWIGYNFGRLRANHFGTFGVTSISALGAESSHFPTPLSTTVNYGVIRDNGDMDVRIMIDHRLIDGSVSARVLQRLEQMLNGPIVDELSAGPQKQVAI